MRIKKGHLRRSRPCKPLRSTTHAHSTTVDSTLSTSAHAPINVAPVPSMSSMMRTLEPFSMPSSRISSLSEPNAADLFQPPRLKSTPTLLQGSFPGFRKGTNGTPSSRATGAAKQYPLLSIPTTAVTPLAAYLLTKVFTTAWNATASPSTVERSLKARPGLGKFSTTVTDSSKRFCSSSVSPSAFNLKLGVDILPREYVDYVLPQSFLG
mmetsp:Transcript_9831/g.19603  ORF Transcript_9831/g.19603 Transcript_9831/m.19603 type:complete len:209 (-) Transcript_9831:76-702(-)